MASLIEQLDGKIADLLASWNIYTTIIVTILAAFIVYPLFFWDEPDTHPLLLARQSQPSPVRQPGESAIYRSVEVAYGYPLKSGLNVKDADTPKWTAGRDGDLRDIWREVIKPSSQGDPTAPSSMIMSVHGKGPAVEHDLADITHAINVIGGHLRQSAGGRVAIYLPNTVEYLAALFACAFYGLTPVLVPYNQPHSTVFDLLDSCGADALIAGAGSLPLADLSRNVPIISRVIWVVEESSRHMDWDATPAESQGKLSVATWHELAGNPRPDTPIALPDATHGYNAGNIVTFWQSKPGAPASVVEFTQKNIVSAVAAMLSALPLRQRLNPSDLVLPADSFSHTYVLCWTLASLYAHASLAINSVAGPGVELTLASRGVSPTVIIASSETLANIHANEVGSISSGIQRIAHVSQAQTMSAGRMPTDNFFFKLLAPTTNAAGSAPGKLRLILASERAGTGSPALSSTALSDLRIITRARICYALTAERVAGAVAQTNMYDYRRDDTPGHSHFGAPLSSVEIKLVDKNDANVDGTTPVGEIVVSGPSVAGGVARLGIRGRIRGDCTLAYE